MKNYQFKVEQGILDCWQITDEIKHIYTSYDNPNVTEDNRFNMLLGLHDLYNLKFEQLFDSYEQLLKEQIYG